MKSKVMKTLCVAGTFLFLVSGCGAKTKSNSKVDTADDNPYGYSKENPVTIKIGMSRDSTWKWEGNETEEDNTWSKLYKEEGYNIDTMYNVDSSQAGTKLTTAIASGNYPDLLSVSASDIVNYAKTGVIADISEVYEKYATDELKEYAEFDDKVGLDMAKVDGKLFAIPKSTNPYQDNAMFMYIRKDWLEKLGLTTPTTMEEFKEVAKAFTENDPDGNGKNDTYGLVLDGKEVFSYIGGMQAFFEAYGAAIGGDAFLEQDGKIIWGGALSKEMKKGLADLQEMYNEGSLAKNFSTMDVNQVNKEINSGKCGIYFGPQWGGELTNISLQKDNANARMVAARIPDGMGKGSSKPYIKKGSNGFFAISSKCKNPEALIKLLNLSVQKQCHPKDAEEYYKYVGKLGTYTGIGASLTMTRSPYEVYDNIVKEKEALETGNKDKLNPSQLNEVTEMERYFSAEKDGTLADKIKNDPTFEVAIDKAFYGGSPYAGGRMMVEMMDDNIGNFCAYNGIPTKKMAETSATLSKLTLESIVKIVTGGDVDDYDAFLKSWSKLGGKEITEEAQKWYDENQ